ncbi:double-strand break repair helicase AddA [Lutimaribacter sp. EGI FJ00015]|uniref:Double-strand break repair helicase AddA n=1 Tax=Lutimaribacter degradans TaxID=2945989 RepID=A0ACC5ZUH9_9RHOB|nr:double-strand break repair helicase AddA [Lutimaribacter sp. EGI FJ00013]MCM2561997.1 double-strand break repair helicase AddA [Lutimaribacter sp. EGI FJ00013]MCO0612971.1 double-strand break repair helicase AddA [Lutimaribacter sp. EGI FJ00015]MCO0635829.1 double-strand break repair helicase AddA [Lutimaribacter sp. EGI FJ00014]
MSLDDATRAQIYAAQPRNSTWLAANAGSGKTRVLTDRVARLLLEGAEPQRILCLTYTKAAASEMQNRLFRRLGEWAMLPNDALRDALRELGHEGPFGDDVLATARTLFARAIETPGGLKIQTIHSFCAAILRRFPLEAEVSPGFTEMEDRAAALMRAEIVQEMADGAEAGVVQSLALHLSDQDFEKVTGEIVGKRGVFAEKPSWNDIARLLGLPDGASRADALRIAFTGEERDTSDAISGVLADQSVTYQKFAAEIAALDLENPSFEVLETLFRYFLYQGGDNIGKSKSVNFPQSNHTKVVEAMAPIVDDVHAWMDRVADAYDFLLACDLADKTAALHDFADAFLPRYAARKQALGWLDFDDLILKARDLLTDERVAAWVLYRLDGGIDHILVDEAQDTSPAQWRVIELLAQEFTAGQGAREDVARTIFVVGDKKQSIYSFQGADPREFDRMQAEFAQRLESTGRPLVHSELSFSFRSAEPILRLVDETFSGKDNSGFPQGNRHRAFKNEMPGRVDLWPVIEPAKQASDGAWHDPVDRISEDHHTKQMARRVAENIRDMLEQATIPEEIGNTGHYRMRHVRAGDILILVQRRSDLFAEIIRACKDLRLPIAGADRLKVGAELAVRDLAALMSFLDLAEDDLSLAVALKSPLFGWSEQDLFTLAHGRGKAYLWQRLRGQAERYPETFAMLNDLRNQTDFLRPYDLIERILTRHDGRRRLLARLGPEAEDGINAFLAQALAYERSEVPSLSGFLQWMETDDLEIKRQMDAAGDRIRVMTVHGAKGLEAPIVILPDAAKRDVQIKDVFMTHRGRAVWRVSKPLMPASGKDVRDTLQDAQKAERDRLLYVAMTRAEKWLIVGAAGDLGKDGDSWYDMIAAGLAHCGQVDHQFPFGPGKRLEAGDWSAPAEEDDAPHAPGPPDLPPHFHDLASQPAHSVQLLSPSDLGGAKALPGDAGQDEEAAKRHGRQVHLLLEHLPGHPPDTWEHLARRILSLGADRAKDTQFRTVLDEVVQILGNPALSDLFGPGSMAEVPLVATLDDRHRLNGVVDRLILTETGVHIVDFKSNATIPDTADQTPEGLLRQLGAYAAALRDIFPGKEVSCAILWTRHARLMPVPAALADAALARFLAAQDENGAA